MYKWYEKERAKIHPFYDRIKDHKELINIIDKKYFKVPMRDDIIYF